MRSATWSDAEFDQVEAPRSPQAPKRDRSLDRMAGTLVHRLFQLKWDRTPEMNDVAEQLGRMTRPEELVDVPDRAQLFQEVAGAFLQLGWRPDVQAWLKAGRPYYEVPFSFVSPEDPGVIIRGSIDCLVAHPDGSARILEFKTGAHRPEHSQQLDVYLAAARQAFPGAEITGELVYPGPD